METEQFIILAKRLVANYSNKKSEVYNGELISPDVVYVVWSCKVLKNHKALLATPLKDNMYFEVTFNGETNEMYLDAYVKEANQVHEIDY